MVTGLSGSNEPNIQYFSYNGNMGIAAANAAQQDLYTAVRSDAKLKSIPVDMYPPAYGFKRYQL